GQTQSPDRRAYDCAIGGRDGGRAVLHHALPRGLPPDRRETGRGRSHRRSARVQLGDTMIRWLCQTALDAHVKLIEHLQAENRWLREQMARERQRAELSIAQRLSEKGLNPVLPQPTYIKDDDLNAMISQKGLFEPTIPEE